MLRLRVAWHQMKVLRSWFSVFFLLLLLHSEISMASFSARKLLSSSSSKYSMAVHPRNHTSGQQFQESKHEVPSGPNPVSNSKRKMTVEIPERPAAAQITVILSGATSEISDPNGEDVGVAAVTEGGNQAAASNGTVVHMNVFSVFSRQMIALDQRVDRIDRQMRTHTFNINGKLARLENKLKDLAKVQQDILRKFDELDHVSDSTILASSEYSSAMERLPLEQKRRMWASKSSSLSSKVAQIRRRRHPRLENLRPNSKTIFIKCYKRMKAKQAAFAINPLVTMDESCHRVIPGSPSHEHRSDDIGSSSTSTSAATEENERKLRICSKKLGLF